MSLLDRIRALFHRREPAAPRTLYTRIEAPLDSGAPELAYRPSRTGNRRPSVLVRLKTWMGIPGLPRELEPLGPAMKVPHNHPTTKVPVVLPPLLHVKWPTPVEPEPNTPQPIVDNANDVTKKGPR